jgi:hypothetical protein
MPLHWAADAWRVELGILLSAFPASVSGQEHRRCSAKHRCSKNEGHLRSGRMTGKQSSLPNLFPKKMSTRKQKIKWDPRGAELLCLGSGPYRAAPHHSAAP